MGEQKKIYSTGCYYSISWIIIFYFIKQFENKWCFHKWLVLLVLNMTTADLLIEWWDYFRQWVLNSFYWRKNLHHLDVCFHLRCIYTVLCPNIPQKFNIFTHIALKTRKFLIITINRSPKTYTTIARYSI